MNKYKSILRIFVYGVVIILTVLSYIYGVKGIRTAHGKEHTHDREPPCDTCPRYGKCVPKIQCPAHVRPTSKNPSCHLDRFGAVGVCCFTGREHAAESERIFRAFASISKEDLKSVHEISRDKLQKYLRNAEKLLEHSVQTLINITEPSFGHHLSLMTYDNRTDVHGHGALLNMFAAEELKARQLISDEELALGLTDHADGPYCYPLPRCQNPPPRYRSIGGECNNPSFPTWGAVFTGFERLLPPDYADRLWSIRAAKSGLPLPSARVISNAVLLDGNHPSATHNLMFMQFGQFIAHDVSSGVVFTAGNDSSISCCANDGHDPLPAELQHFACAPITTRSDDRFFGVFHVRCLNFVRSQLAPASDCSVGYARQMNGATHYPDLSQLYGKSEEKLQTLRSPFGMLATFNDYGRHLPPLTTRRECLTSKQGSACFDSGDEHGNQVISLTALHVIWTREHNRVADALAQINPLWDDDTLFMESRRIVQAEYQHIIYNEWLPELLGPQMVKMFDLAPSPSYSSSYDPLVNPSLLSEFAAAAMRFGHSTVDGKIVIPSQTTGGVHESIAISELMFQPSRMRLRPFLDRLLVGMTMQPMQSVDPFVTEGLTNYLFHGGNPYGLDLAAINIQRGRDHGLHSYNDYRRLIGLQPFLEFQQFPPSAAQRLASVYERPEDIDLWVGGLLEKPIIGGVVGPTFANIIAEQFTHLKKGDRYFYEYGPEINPGAFTPSQLAEIKKVSLSRIICDNSDGIELLTQPPEAFLRADLPGNEPMRCDSPRIPTVDLYQFQ